jgi:hypothetical protein
MIETTEDAILKQLRGAFPQLEVDRFEDDIAEYNFTHPLGAVLVVLRQGTYGDSPVLSGTYRPIYPEFNVASFTHGLRGDPGAYALIQDIDEALRLTEVEGTGDHPGGHLRMQRTFFIDSRPGPVWVYGQNVKLTRVS